MLLTLEYIEQTPGTNHCEQSISFVVVQCRLAVYTFAGDREFFPWDTSGTHSNRTTRSACFGANIRQDKKRNETFVYLRFFLSV